MVYCGKPSRGCQMCRTRRIKCDETKPTCNQCAKSHRQCPGYKDEFDIIFRNETKATERRAKKKAASGSASASSSSAPVIAAIQRRKGSAGQEPISPVASEASSGSSPGTRTLATLSPVLKSLLKSPLGLATIQPALGIPLSTKASCHFVANFVLIPRQGSTRGFLEYLVPLLKTSSPTSHLQHAFNSCALASMGNRVGHAQTIDFSARAYDEYTKALREVNLALRDPEEGKSDGTLAAVLLLGLFENISARQMGDFAWGSHVEGAIQIVKARGRRQLRTKMGLLLFIAVRTQLIIHTLTSGKAPIMGADWWLADAVKDEAAFACQRINLRASELRAEVTGVMATVVAVSRTPENVELILALMRRAQALDDECMAWTQSLPAHWQYKTLCWEDNVPGGDDYARAEVFPGRVDVYSDFWIASVWNMIRTTRLILHSAVVRCAAWVCAPVDYRTTPEYATAARVCGEAITDVLASVPYHLGWPAKRRHLFADAAEAELLSGFACGQEDSLKGLAGYFLTWPLACIMGQDYVSDRQRAWVGGRLRYIGDELGIRYAHILGQLQIRIPSMMIRRDALMAQPYPSAHNFVKLLSSDTRIAASKEQVELKKAEMLAKTTAGEVAGSEEVYKPAQKWLTV